MLTADTLTLHVRFQGRSEDLTLKELELLPEAGDADLRAALARRYDVTPAALDGCVIVREKQAIIVRPIAYYG